MSAYPIIAGLLYRVRGYGIDKIVSAINGADAIARATEGLTCEN